MSIIKKEKIQITLPIALAKKIEEDIKSKSTNKSLWFEKIISDYFEEKEEKGYNYSKKLIELNI